MEKIILKMTFLAAFQTFLLVSSVAKAEETKSEYILVVCPTFVSTASPQGFARARHVFSVYENKMKSQLLSRMEQSGLTVSDGGTFPVSVSSIAQSYCDYSAPFFESLQKVAFENKKLVLILNLFENSSLNYTPTEFTYYSMRITLQILRPVERYINGFNSPLGSNADEKRDAAYGWRYFGGFKWDSKSYPEMETPKEPDSNPAFAEVLKLLNFREIRKFKGQ